VLEKDKIVMSKWIEMAKIKTPKIHYYSYHDQFTFDKLCNVIEQNEGKSLIIKITHLQSNYGIILVPPDPTIEKIEQIYKTCQDKFKTSFVCNHDFSDPPTNKEIKMGRKPSYYKLYETIKPGVIIQEYFESYTDGSKNIPIEYKILMYGDKILNIGGGLLTSTSIYMDQERYEPLVEEARKISKFLGATLIRVDFFVRENDNPYIPYLNEISLSPNGGMNRAMAFSNLELDEMKKEMNNTPRGNYGELNKLIQQCPYRYTPIERYLTDAESVKEKY
jgi:D-alanine-D-alanine ligase-like ATP-grasp enzyme